MSRASAATAAARPQQQQPRDIDPETPLLDAMMLERVGKLEKTSEVISRQLNDPAISRMQHSLTKGLAIARLKQMITPEILKVLISLMNTKHGFKTDRGPKQKKPDAQMPYPAEIVVDCAIAALLDGVLWAGNQFNIIAGECYITGEGWEYKLNNLPGFSDLTPYPGTPVLHNGQTCVRFGASWKYNGVRRELKDAKGEPGVIFAIKTDTYSGPDQIIGKARAKAYKLIYKTLTSSTQTISADEQLDIIDDPSFLKGRITDSQEADLNAAIADHDASALLIRDFYGLVNGQRLLATEFEACMAKIRAGDFSAPREGGAGLADGELPNEAEFTAEDVEIALTEAGQEHLAVWRRHGVKRAADLTQEQRRQIMDELAQAVA